jgi:hypothetical protein
MVSALHSSRRLADRAAPHLGIRPIHERRCHVSQNLSNRFGFFSPGGWTDGWAGMVRETDWGTHLLSFWPCYGSSVCMWRCMGAPEMSKILRRTTRCSHSAQLLSPDARFFALSPFPRSSEAWGVLSIPIRQRRAGIIFVSRVRVGGGDRATGGAGRLRDVSSCSVLLAFCVSGRQRLEGGSGFGGFVFYLFPDPPSSDAPLCELDDVITPPSINEQSLISESPSPS